MCRKLIYKIVLCIGAVSELQHRKTVGTRTFFQSHLVSLMTAIALAWLSWTSPAMAFDFSVDPQGSPIGGGPADIHTADGSALKITAADLGLPASVNIDGFSYGRDTVEPIGLYNYVVLSYSVDRQALGNGGAISTQVGLNGAAGDKFNVRYVGYRGQFFPILGPRRISDAPSHNLDPLPLQSDLDGLSKGGQGDYPFFFTVDGAGVPGQPWGPADILVKWTPQSPSVDPVQRFASAVDLNLQPDDNIDGLALGARVGFDPPTAFDADIIVWVSLSQGSPTRALFGGESVLQVYPEVAIAADAPTLGILSSDELNALTAYDPGPDPVGLTNLEASIIDNPGFEEPPYADGDWGDATGWTGGYYDRTDPGVWVAYAGDAGGYNPEAVAHGYGGFAPEGENVAWIMSYVGCDCGLSQVLSATLQANTQYYLSALVGNPVVYNWGPTCDYRIELLAGGVLLESDMGPSPVDDTTWITASLTYNSGASPAQLGQPLEIRILAINSNGFDEVDYDAVKLLCDVGAEPGVTIPVDTNSDLAAANALANPGDTILFAEGTYNITSQIIVKEGVTYIGAGPELTIIDGNDATRAFAAWGDRGATDGQVDANGDGVPNLTGPTRWVIDGLTIQNCVSDAENRQNILSAARDLLNNYTGTPYTLATAQDENGGVTDNPEWFDILSGSADDDLTDAELQAYLDANPVGSEGHLVANDDKRDDGGAVLILNGADGTIRNCAFSNNTAVDDGGAIMVDGHDLDVTIDNCAFNLNTCGDQGGALKLSGAASNSTVTGCSFTENSAPEDDAGAIIMDGGAGSPGSVYTLTDCIFTGCSALDDGGAILATADDSTYMWTNCTFIGNYVTDSGADGGAVRYAPDRADITVTNCSFIGNGKDPNGTPVGDDGGAWKTDDDDCGPVTFMNCLFADNASKDDRIIGLNAAFALLNCTFIGNVVGDEALIGIRGQPWNSTGDTDENGDDIDDVFTDDSIINNCLFINNTLLSNKQVIGDTRDDVFAPTVINCLFFGNLDQNGNPAENTDDNSVEVGTIDVSAVTDASQLVVDPTGDYHLVADSAAIDASDPATATDADIEGTAAVGVRDVGAYEWPAN